MKISLLLTILFSFVAQAAPLKVGDSAPCVVLEHVYPNGDKTHCIREPEKAGQLVLLEFFSAFCSDCKKNLPIVSKLHADLKDKLTVRLVGIDRDTKVLRSYANNNNLDFSLAIDSDRDAKSAYGVRATPTLFILDETNTVVYTHRGVLTPADVTDIETLVEAN